MKHLLFLAFLLPINAHAQSITYTWPDLDINPNSYAQYSDASFIGRVAQWHGVEACVRKEGDVRHYSSYDWPASHGRAHVRLACLAFKPLEMDTIIITHRHGADGPDRLRVSLVDGLSEPLVLSDGAIAEGYEALVLPVSRYMAPSLASEYEQVQILIEPYGGKGGAWDLRSVRIDATDPSAMKPFAAKPTALPTIPDERMVNAAGFPK